MERLKAILERRKNMRGRSRYPIDNFIDKYFNAENLLEQINKKIHSKQLLQEAKEQYIISIVTAFEVFLKDTCIQLVDRYGLDYGKEIRSFNLSEVKYIIEKKISIGEVIVGHCNFQSLDKIQDTFSSLMGFNFFEKLKRYKWWFDKNSPKGFMQITPNFYLKIAELIKLRHNFVHDINFKRILTAHKIKNLSEELLLFVSLIDFFIDDVLNSRIKITNL